MFEASLIDLEPKKRSRRAWILPVALAIHIVGLGTVAFASYWTVGEVPEPNGNMGPVIVQLLPPPPPPPPPPGGPVTEPTPTPVPEPRPVDVEVQQPDLEQIPDEISEISPIPQVVDLTAVSDAPGEPGGVPGGVLGGVPNGVPGGVLNGEPNGTPGGQLGGIPGGMGEVQAVRLTAAMVRPQVLHSVQPRYTEAGRKAGVQGAVIVEAIINERGKVTDIHVLRGLPAGLEQSAVDAVRQWTFKPATLDGRPVKVYFTLTVNFTIQR